MPDFMNKIMRTDDTKNWPRSLGKKVGHCMRWREAEMMNGCACYPHIISGNREISRLIFHIVYIRLPLAIMKKCRMMELTLLFLSRSHTHHLSLSLRHMYSFSHTYALSLPLPCSSTDLAVHHVKF